MIGVPLGSADFTASFVGNVLVKGRDVMDALRDCEDTQAAFFLLKSSYDIV
jgi:hypothetical protein